MDFKQEFSKVIREAASADLSYKSFWELCSKLLPADAYPRYCALKKRDYIAKDEYDVNVYVKYVAARHRDKFSALYGALFKKYSKVLTDCVELVVWGCGCGLDLLALHDQAMKEKNPNFWLSVKSITLIDVSRPALDRAKQIADVLFPDAMVIVKEVNLKNQKSLSDIVLNDSLIVVPRVHLFSNLLDIFNDVEFNCFVNKVRSVSKRCEGLRNDVFIAFSPNIPNANVRYKMREFKNAFLCEGLDSELVEFVVKDNTPERCECAAFLLRSKGVDYFKPLDEDKENFFKRLRRIAIKDPDSLPWKDVFEFFLEEKRYSAVLPRFLMQVRCTLDDTSSGKSSVSCLVIIAPKEQKKKLLVVVRRDIANEFHHKWKIAKTVLKFIVPYVRDEGLIKLFLELGNQQSNRDRYIFDYLNVVYWDVERKTVVMDEFDQNNRNAFARALPREVDFTGAYYVDTKGIEPLPSLSSAQRAIVEHRKRCLRVRGGPGTGKTVTMLWRAIEAFKRTHMPVLILCKTNSLVSYHEKVLAATLEQDLNIENVLRGNFVFDTVDHYLCEEIKEHVSCKIPTGCSRDKMDKLCDECRMTRRKILCSDMDIPFRKYGAVLLDEAQIIDAADVRTIYTITGRANVCCDFYMFCDEEQAMRGAADILISDNESQKRVVKAPDKGFGKFVTLKSNFRALNQDLLSVFKFVQWKMADKYDIEELGMETKSEGLQLSLAIHVAFAVACKRNVSFEDWERWIKPDLDANSDRGDVLLMIDNEDRLRSFYGEIKSKKQEAQWVVTHREVKNFKDEQKLKREFYQNRDKIHLTTVDCAQGQTFDNVVLVVTRRNSGNLEELFSGMTRARKTLRIVDASQNQWVYNMLKGYNSYEVKIVEDVSKKTFQGFDSDDIPF